MWLFFLLSVLSLARSEEEVTVRLSSEVRDYFGAGYLELWREGRWGAVCAGSDSWSQATAHLVCRHLGYSESRDHQLGETNQSDALETKKRAILTLMTCGKSIALDEFGDQLKMLWESGHRF